MIPRIQKEQIEIKLAEGKLLMVEGPRRVGKSTLVREILEERQLDFQWFDCSDKNQIKQLSDANNLSGSLGSYLVLYEAQFLPNLSEIIENVLAGDVQATLIVICSYAPDIPEELREALRMGGFLMYLYAPSFYESAKHFGLTVEERLLEERLIYGNYPEVLADLDQAEDRLEDILRTAIFSHLSTKERINKEDKLIRMLQLLAFSIGDTISYHDIAVRCGLDNETVERYIQLLERAHLLIVLPSFHNGHRYELKKSHCIYFVDNGIRNRLIRNFNPTELRMDMDVLWRNYVIAERIKWMRINGLKSEVFFWKTHTRQTVDLIEVREKETVGYKTDWEKRKKIKIPQLFSTAYPNCKCSVINRSTYWRFLTQTH